MKRFSILSFTVLLTIEIMYAQQQKVDSFFWSIKWGKEFVQKKDHISTSVSITAYAFIDSTTISMLVGDEQKILIYSTSTNALIKTIHLPYGAIDFDYNEERFYILDFDKLYIINSSGNIEQELNYRRPVGIPFAVEKFKHINGRNIINIADGTTWELSLDGLKQIDNYFWYFNGGFRGRTEKNDLKGFDLTIAKGSNIVSKEAIQINGFGLKDDLATVKIISIDTNKIAFDIETSKNLKNDFPKRFLVFTDLQGVFISKTEIPFIYYTYIQNPFGVSEKDIVYSLFTQQGLYFYRLNVSSNGVDLPAGVQGIYHQKFNLPKIEKVIEEDTNLKKNIDNDSPKAGNNCVTRTQVWENAYKFRDLVWAATSSNFVTSCTQINGKWIRTPSNPGTTNGWITVGTNTSVPYKWGGFTDWPIFASLASQGKKTGNMAIWHDEDTPPNYLCGGTEDNVHSDASDNDVIGVDCSGFVSRCWETTRKTTISLEGISTNIGFAYIASNFSQLQPGDIVNKYGSHTMLCLEQNPSGTATFMEATGGYSNGSNGWKVDNYSHSVSYFNLTENQTYKVRKYNNINDARLRLAQAITISPTTVVQGEPLTVTYKIGNYGTESWTGSVKLYIIQSDGDEVSLQTQGPITLEANQPSSIYTFTSNSIISPVGETQLEVRVKNSNSCDYQRYYNVGAGSYSNPLTFTIYPGSTYDPCASISSIGGCGSSYSKTYTGGGTGAWFTSTVNPCYFETPGEEKIYSFVAPASGTYSIQVTAASGYVDYLWKTGYCSSSGWNCIDDINSTGQFGSMSWNAGTTYYILLDDKDNSSGPHTFYINCPVSNYNITTSSNPTAGGTTSGSGIYQSGASCTVTASENSGYSFINWTENGTEVSVTESYPFTVSANRNLVANFNQQSAPCSECPSYNFIDNPTSNWQTSTSSIGSGGCKIYKFASAPGYTYVYKTGCGDGATADFNTYLELMDYNCSSLANDDNDCESNRSIIQWTCNYSGAGYVYLKVRGYGASDYGNFTLSFIRIDPIINYQITTTANPSSGGTTSGGGTYQSGQSCTVTASSNNGYTFANWTENGTEVSVTESYPFTVSANRTLVANFTVTPVSYTISTSSNPAAGGTTSGGGTFQSGQECFLTASVNNGYSFINWTEGGTQVAR
ncbi:MAG: hypothetical protein WCI71_04010 [Bacteroidota bacterium]